MFQETFTVEIKGDVLDSLGVDWGRPLKILFHKGDRIVVRCAGHLAWAGRGAPRKYAETKYMLLALAKGENPGRMRATVLQEIEPGPDWRPVVATLIQKAGGEAPPPKSKGGQTVTVEVPFTAAEVEDIRIGSGGSGDRPSKSVSKERLHTFVLEAVRLHMESTRARALTRR